MKDPLADDPKILRAIRYIELNPRDMATVTVKCLRRLGKVTPHMEPRRLDEEEIMLLTDEDFKW